MPSPVDREQAEREPGERASHLLFMVAFGLAGWTALLSATYMPGFAPVTPRPAEPLAFAMFFLVVVAARGMAFHLLPETLVSLDSAFYIAAAACLGTVTAGRLVALALTLDALLRLIGTDATGRRPRASWVESLTFVFYFGGMSGGLLMLTGWAFGVDAHALVGREDAELHVLGRVASLGAAFLVAHYLIQGMRLWLKGTPVSVYARRMAAPGMLAETSLLPLAVVVVLIYHPDRPLGFALLGVTYLLINFVFNRLSHASASLRQRVGELETLNRTARSMASTLQQHELIETIARETLETLPEAEIVSLALRDGGAGGGAGGGGLAVDYVERETGEFRRVRARAEDGPTGAILKQRQPLVIPDLKRSDFGLRGDPTIRSWMGAPIVIYDEAVGVLSVQSRERGAFGPHEQRVLEAIGAQAAVAIQNARLYELATVDGLTGLYVRRYFDSRLREELERSRRFGAPFSLVLLDVDNFKQLNDTYGHQLGDRVLKEIASVMRRNMRGVDIPARYGGEEFAFILPRTAMVDAHAVAERIRQDVADTPITHDDKVVRVTASLGVACYPDSGEGDAAALVQRADTALYRAKQTGKNRVELYWRADEEPVRKLRPVS